MQALLDWISVVNWGQYDIIKYIILAVIVICMIDLLFGFITSFIVSIFGGGKR